MASRVVHLMACSTLLRLRWSGPIIAQTRRTACWAAELLLIRSSGFVPHARKREGKLMTRPHIELLEESNARQEFFERERYLSVLNTYPRRFARS